MSHYADAFAAFGMDSADRGLPSSCPIRRCDVKRCPVGQLMRRLRSCDSGTGLVEYGLLLAVLALGLVGVVTLLRNSVEGLTTSVSVAISEPGSGGQVPPASTIPTRPHTKPTANLPEPAGSDGDSETSEDPSADPDSSTAEPDGSTVATRASIWLPH